jgi:hypothetical protein
MTRKFDTQKLIRNVIVAVAASLLATAFWMASPVVGVGALAGSQFMLTGHVRWWARLLGVACALSVGFLFGIFGGVAAFGLASLGLLLLDAALGAEVLRDELTFNFAPPQSER